MNNFWFEKIKEYKNYRYLLTKFDFKNLNECSNMIKITLNSKTTS